MTRLKKLFLHIYMMTSYFAHFDWLVCLCLSACLSVCLESLTGYFSGDMCQYQWQIVVFVFQLSGSKLKHLVPFEAGTHNDTCSCPGYYESISKFMYEVNTHLVFKKVHCAFFTCPPKSLCIFIFNWLVPFTADFNNFCVFWNVRFIYLIELRFLIGIWIITKWGGLFTFSNSAW